MDFKNQLISTKSRSQSESTQTFAKNIERSTNGMILKRLFVLSSSAKPKSLHLVKFQPPAHMINWLVNYADCVLCNASINLRNTQFQNSAPLICEDCHQRLPKVGPACMTCAMPLAINSHSTGAPETRNRCGSCLSDSPPYQLTIAAFHYQPPISDFIANLKFNGQNQALKLLTNPLIEKIRLAYQSDQLPQTILPTPLHPSKLKLRGFNQAQIIAQQIAKKLAVKIDARCVVRQKPTRSQVTLDASQRAKNLKNAFKLIKEPAEHVAIVDDVMTTGTTMRELASCLLDSGVKRVDVWCIARAYTN